MAAGPSPPAQSLNRLIAQSPNRFSPLAPRLAFRALRFASSPSFPVIPWQAHNGRLAQDPGVPKPARSLILGIPC